MAAKKAAKKKSPGTGARKKAAGARKKTAKQPAAERAPGRSAGTAGKKAAKKAGEPARKKAATAARKKAAGKKPATTGKKKSTPKPRRTASSTDVNLGHVFSLRPRVNTAFRQQDFLDARRVLAEERYADLGEAARAVAEKALELTRSGAPAAAREKRR